MSRENIAVVVDSGSSMRGCDRDVVEKNIRILPLEVIFRNESKDIVYKDTDLSAPDFYIMLREARVIPTTSGAITGPAQILYESIAREGKTEIISVHVTSKHSTAFDSAVIAARQTNENFPDLKIGVIDSKVISAGTWFLAEKATRMVDEGVNFDEIVKILQTDANKIELWAVLDTLKYVAMGGRIPAYRAKMGNLLQIKPILGFVDGTITPMGQRMTMTKAEYELVARVNKIAKEIENIAILHTNNLEWARKLQQDIADIFPREIPIYEAGPALAVHAGPGAIGVTVLKR